MKPPTISKKFPLAKRNLILEWMPFILIEVEEIARGQRLKFTRWPVSVSPMTRKEIAEDKKWGGGHGAYVIDTEEIRLKSSMRPFGLVLNLIHELWHHVDPDADEEYINGVIVPWVYENLTGEKLEPIAWSNFRGHNWRGAKRKKNHGCVR